MAAIPILFLRVAIVAAALGGCVDLPAAAASAVQELIATSLAFSAITAIAFRGTLAHDRNPEGG